MPAPSKRNWVFADSSTGKKVTKQLQKKIEPVPSDNKTIDQLKFSTQKKEKLIIEDKPLIDKIKIESFS